MCILFGKQLEAGRFNSPTLQVEWLRIKEGGQGWGQTTRPGLTHSLGRYHSMTRQLLRKADGVVLMYDVTSQESFVHVRYWLDCIQVSRCCWSWPQFLKSRGNLYPAHFPFSPRITNDTIYV